MVLTCDICGKKIFTSFSDNWPYRHGNKIFCSENCKIVHAARDLHKIEYIRMDEGPLTGFTPFVFGKESHPVKYIDKEERKEEMRRNPLLEEQNERAIEIAMEGGDPIPYLKECGAANPYGNWGYIKMKLQKSDPERYEKLMKIDKRGRKPAMVEKADKLPEEAKESTPMDRFKLPAQQKTCRTPEKEQEEKDNLEYKVIGIETKLGKFQYDAASNQMRWMPKGSMVVVMMPAEDWEKMAADLPMIMKAIGADNRKDDDE